MGTLGKIFLAATVISLSVGLFAGMGVSAATYSGEFTELYGDTYSWSVDTDIKTLIIDGNGGSGYFMDNITSPWLPYVKDIETVIIDSSIPANNGLRIHTTDELKNLKKLVQVDGDFKATHDLAAKTTTLSGKGKWPEDFVIMPGCEKLIVEDGITEIEGFLPYQCRDIVLGKDVKLEDPYRIWGYEEITVSNKNPYYSSYGNCLYTKDYKNLLVSPYNSTSLKLHPDVKVIEENSLPNGLTSTLVLPWGATTVEKNVFNDFENRVTVVIPNTVTNFDPGYNNSDEVIFMIAKGNDKLFNTLVKTGTEIWTTGNIGQYYPGVDVGKPVEPEKPENSQEPQQPEEPFTGWFQENGKWYYNINSVKQGGWLQQGGHWYYLNPQKGYRMTGWQIVNGVWYYMDTNGVMQTGWLTYNGSTYYLRPWGGMMVNGWYQIDGKWYYFNSWGGIAKSQWLYGLDKKWYYVGPDGVMLTNTRTPDGYWVDRNGVWVR